MKFTEGYWLRSERVKASFATQAFEVQEIPHGMRILAPERPILSRADALDLTVLQIDFVSARHNDIAVTVTHYKAYDDHVPRFDLDLDPDHVIEFLREMEKTGADVVIGSKMHKDSG